ncbi:immunity 49 family protein [Streptomyces sp. DG1A-41]|uniref:immunity 49 family protein n=1 Tax=Streptomyces sp. DG1A-41 TaxID=3125779 RepID=UPI0030CCF098
MTPDNVADPELPMLSAAQATHLRALAAPHYREGHQYSLDSLAHTCSKTPEEHWPDLVAAHFGRLRQASQGDESVAGLLRGVHARLLPVESITPELSGVLRYARVVADGLVFAYALDGPTSVRILTDRDVERVGLQALGDAARANLMRVPVRHEEVGVEGQARLHSVYGDSPFVAGKALFLAELAWKGVGEKLPDAGALVVVPTRHNLVYHPITDGSVVDAVNSLAAYALGAHEDGPGALSPRVYWWHRGSLTSLTVIDQDTLTFSVRPPSHLLGLMKGLVRLDGAGRLASRAAAASCDPGELTRAATESMDRLVQEGTAGLGDAFASALTLALARCATDPDVAHIDTWDAWATATRLGSALFTGAPSQECRLGEDRVWRLPALPAEPPADARAWLDALYLAIVCRQTDRIGRLCRVPLEVLRQDDSVDEYVLHWIGTLQAYFSNGPSMDDVVEKLVATIETSGREGVTRAPLEFVNGIDYQPAALFHRLIARDHDTFAKVLAEAVAEHGSYWGASAAPRARVALGPLAMASLAYDYGFPVDLAQPYLPRHLLNRERLEEIC